MDANQWKQIVDKALLRTDSGKLRWSKSNLGPVGTLSFETSIDDSTTLNIWGFEKNYSFELCVERQTADGPFEQRKRVKTKGNAEGIDFRGLLNAAKKQVAEMVRDNAYEAVMDFLDNPTVLDPETGEALFPENERERSKHLSDLGTGWFHYAQVENILTRIRDLTASESISWTLFKESDESNDQVFSCSVGDSDEDGNRCLDLEFRVIPASSTANRKPAYNFHMEKDSWFWVDVDIRPTAKWDQDSWLLISEIHSIALAQSRRNEEEFRKIIRDSIFHDILASLDDSHK